ncbi:hypothetical protein K488DRAFT_73441 [Vararia minispora EC-137]|uniref:Uncharacterized protein n=1 Tax=Vararia minispora EC-137 TaxID=1314806 RepID=A0ACB8QC59_9AGAM|nr:hypothetical protein K488DRAFT_73441 [Vararia minispora EC-137]
MAATQVLPWDVTKRRDLLNASRRRLSLIRTWSTHGIPSELRRQYRMVHSRVGTVPHRVFLDSLAKEELEEHVTVPDVPCTSYLAHYVYAATLAATATRQHPFILGAGPKGELNVQIHSCEHKQSLSIYLGGVFQRFLETIGRTGQIESNMGHLRERKEEHETAAVVTSLPCELLSLVFAHVHRDAASLPSATPSLDPLYLLLVAALTSRLASYPPACRSEPVARYRVFSATLAGRVWSKAALGLDNERDTGAAQRKACDCSCLDEEATEETILSGPVRGISAELHPPSTSLWCPAGKIRFTASHRQLILGNIRIFLFIATFCFGYCSSRTVGRGVSSTISIPITFTPSETPNMVTFGASEYMDGAPTLSVFRELLRRGNIVGTHDCPPCGHGLVVANDPDIADIARRGEQEALGLTSCISGIIMVQVNVSTGFIITHFLRRSSSDFDRVVNFGGNSSPPARLVYLPVAPRILTAFISACPSLTSETRVEPVLLGKLDASRTIQLQSLVLARLCEFSLYGDAAFPCPLSREELRDVIERAPCFASGALRYPDISTGSAPPNCTLLSLIPFQPALRSLGLAHALDLPSDDVVRFPKDKTPQVEVLVPLGTNWA